MAMGKPQAAEVATACWIGTLRQTRKGTVSEPPPMPKIADAQPITPPAIVSVGLPGTSGFVGEFLSLAGAYKVSTWATLIATTGIILGAGYMLYLYRRIAFGEQVNADAAAMSDLDRREMWLLAPIAAVVLWMGVYPESFLSPIRRDVAMIVERIERAAPAGDSKLKENDKTTAKYRVQAHDGGEHAKSAEGAAH